MNPINIEVPEFDPPDGGPGPRAFRVSAASGATVIELFDDITLVESKRLLAEIGAVKSKSLELRINSHGGYVFGGLAVYNALARFAGTVNVEIEGVAASMASAIAMAGHRIRISEAAYLMIHEPQCGVDGGEKELQEAASLLAKIRESLADIYSTRTGQTRARVLEMMAAETWMTAQEAVKLGFADEVRGRAKAVARFDPSRYRNLPAALAGDRSTAARSVETLHAAVARLQSSRSKLGSEDRREIRLACARLGNVLQEEAEQPAANQDAVRELVSRVLATSKEADDEPMGRLRAQLERFRESALVARFLNPSSTV